MKPNKAYFVSFEENGYINFLEQLFLECDCLSFYMRESQPTLNKKEQQFLANILQNVINIEPEEIEEELYGRMQRNYYQISITPELAEIFKNRYSDIQSLFEDRIFEDWMFLKYNNVVFWLISEFQQGILTIYFDKTLENLLSTSEVTFAETNILR